MRYSKASYLLSSCIIFFSICCIPSKGISIDKNKVAFNIEHKVKSEPGIAKISSLKMPKRFVVGVSYKIKNKVYKPKIDLTYSEVGIASWYGPGFHNKKTAHGSRYNQYSYTVAHRTLPMPSVVQITNLENGGSIKAVVTDRGPFAKDRIIDVSKTIAKDLGFLKQGTTKVKVEYLHADTLALIGNFPEKEKRKAHLAFAKAEVENSVKVADNSSIKFID